MSFIGLIKLVIEEVLLVKNLDLLDAAQPLLHPFVDFHVIITALLSQSGEDLFIDLGKEHQHQRHQYQNGQGNGSVLDQQVNEKGSADHALGAQLYAALYDPVKIACIHIDIPQQLRAVFGNMKQIRLMQVAVHHLVRQNVQIFIYETILPVVHKDQISILNDVNQDHHADQHQGKLQIGLQM